MSEEEKQAIERIKDILKYGKDIESIEDEEQREIEKSAYFEEMPFGSFKILLNLIDKQQKEIEELHKERNKLVNPSNLQISYFDNKSQTQVVINGFVSKNKVRELANKIHKTLDVNGITRAYQITIDYDFRKLLGEEDE